jgi:hypothetical protein
MLNFNKMLAIEGSYAMSFFVQVVRLEIEFATLPERR